MSNPLNHLDAALARAARRVEEARAAAKPKLDEAKFAADDHLPDGTIKPTAKPKPPPLGLMPWHLWVEQRKEDLIDALARYGEAGVEPPPEWEQELDALTALHLPNLAALGQALKQRGFLDGLQWSGADLARDVKAQEINVLAESLDARSREAGERFAALVRLVREGAILARDVEEAHEINVKAATLDARARVEEARAQRQLLAAMNKGQGKELQDAKQLFQGDPLGHNPDTNTNRAPGKAATPGHSSALIRHQR
jgi:hypothetical protein